MFPWKFNLGVSYAFVTVHWLAWLSSSLRVKRRSSSLRVKRRSSSLRVDRRTRISTTWKISVIRKATQDLWITLIFWNGLTNIFLRIATMTALVNSVVNLWVSWNLGNFLTVWLDQLLKKDAAPWITLLSQLPNRNMAPTSSSLSLPDISSDVRTHSLYKYTPHKIYRYPHEIFILSISCLASVVH